MIQRRKEKMKLYKTYKIPIIYPEKEKLKLDMLHKCWYILVKDCVLKTVRLGVVKQLDL